MRHVIMPGINITPLGYNYKHLFGLLRNLGEQTMSNAPTASSGPRPFSTAWWHVAPTRTQVEPTYQTASLLCPDGYMAAETDSDAAQALEDYRRVILSLSLRGLKDKTQVFSLEQERFVRTRLSHSYEVATNASRLLSEIMARGTDGTKAPAGSAGTVAAQLDNPDDVETLRNSLMAACLLHDTGNPPFGHEGENIVRRWFVAHREQLASAAGVPADDPELRTLMADLERYEGNANSLRIALSSSCMFDGRRLNLTGTTIAALVKYPWDSSDPRAQARKKFNFFRSDLHRIQAMLDADPHMPALLDGERHPLSYILEAADDISYATSDLEDSFRMGTFTLHELFEYLFDFSPIDMPRTPFDTGAYKLSPLVDLASGDGSYTFSDFNLLALLAGDRADIARFDTLRRLLTECGAPELQALVTGPANLYQRTEPKSGQNGSAAPGVDFSRFTHYIKSNRDALAFLGTPDNLMHTFINAAEEHPGINAQERRQMQETYMARWVDLIRRWLYFSTARSFVSLMSECGEVRDADDLFGNRINTVRLAKKAATHFVFLSEDRIKTEALAHSILNDLLDRFVLDAISCNDPVGKPHGVIGLIPIRYRLDYLERLHAYEQRHNGTTWNEARGMYERCLMALDFICSMTDGYALELHQRLA